MEKYMATNTNQKKIILTKCICSQKYSYKIHKAKNDRPGKKMDRSTMDSFKSSFLVAYFNTNRPKNSKHTEI